MRKIILSTLASFSMIAAIAQAVPNATFTDCNSNTRSVYQALATGKVLLVANAGTNCSICMGHASQVGDLATNYMSTIEVWGSMTTKTGGMTDCNTVNNWVSTYGWDDVFAFLDNNKYWFNTATPGFTVINPSDSTIAYQGSNWNTARSAAIAIASTFDVKEENVITGVSVGPNEIFVEVSNAVSGTFVMYDVTGKMVDKWQVQSNGLTIKLPLNKTPVSGIYILQIKIGDADVVKKIMF